ncbi:PD-(D/E)XK motif protein [Bacillus sp. WMMC1349]|uniref:PD-(D/E)XK motif protein n=1 Tax=Bacillus sp. WMMC1349 TaxID=2736254 RepID=UPI0015549BE1|nr:PD-(D/E)XK motif protein [Bacillus sp. WMMC1349]NPC91931.1 PD-(D/E)XK motif protein [Bacillus sp. WMMC1349]
MERIGLTYKEIDNSVTFGVLLESQLKARLIKDLSFTSIFLAINAEHKRLFLLGLTRIMEKDTVDKFPTWKGINIYQKKMFNPLTNKEGWFLVFEQQDLIANEIFEYLVGDILEFIIDSTTLNQLQSRLKKVLFKWQAFFSKNSTTGMSEQQQQGLLGELTFIYQALKSTSSPRKIISSWYGADKEKIDFQIGNVGIEIKTSSAGRPYRVTISAEDQLETSQEIDLYLYCIMLERSKRLGVTILDIIKDIRLLLNEYPDVLLEFNNKLFICGIIEPNLNEGKLIKFIVKDTFYFTVEAEFPRITKSILPLGILNVKYQLSLDSCNSFQVQEEQVLYKVKEVIQ